MLCYTCESLVIPIVNSGHASVGIRLSSSLRQLKQSAKSCSSCALSCNTLESVRIKGVNNDVIGLFQWASDAVGDPFGMSRGFVQIGEKVGLFLDVFAEPSMLLENHLTMDTFRVMRHAVTSY